MTIHKYLKKERLFLFSCFSALLSLVSCQKQPNLTFGSTYIDDNNSANIVVVDTSTVAVSTVVVDSTATAGTGFLNVGTYNDPYFGKITSRAFMQLIPGTLPTISNFDNYDSVALILLYKKGNPYYGDTTITQTITVNQVDTLYEIAPYRDGFWSNSSFPVVSTPLGTASYSIRPSIPFTSQGIGDSLKIKLNDNLGKTLYNMIYNKSDTINKAAIWLKWFHGICLQPGAGSQGAIYGFQDSAVMRIYYHQAAAYAVQKFIDFGITNKSYQFNNIVTDRSATALAKLNKPTLPKQTPPTTGSDTLAHAGYVQTITGLDVKMTFPYLQAIAHRADYLSVLRAQLIVRPVPGSWSTQWTLPPALNIYSSDLHNTIGTAIVSSQTGAIQTGSMKPDYLHPLTTQYTYDITNFIKAQITNVSTTAKDFGIYLTAPSPASESSFARAVLSDGTYPVNERVTLQVYYIALYPHN